MKKPGGGIVFIVGKEGGAVVDVCQEGLEK